MAGKALKSIARTAMAPMVIVCASMFMNGCTGCSDTSSVRHDAPAVPLDVTDVRDILSVPVSFDAQSVADAERMVCSSNEPAASETAQAIIVAEAAADRLTAILDSLAAGDDDAEALQVLDDLIQEAWPRQLTAIVTALDDLSLDATQRERLYGLQSALEHCRETVYRLQARCASLPSPF